MPWCDRMDGFGCDVGDGGATGNQLSQEHEHGHQPGRERGVSVAVLSWADLPAQAFCCCPAGGGEGNGADGWHSPGQDVGQPLPGALQALTALLLGGTAGHQGCGSHSSTKLQPRDTAYSRAPGQGAALGSPRCSLGPAGAGGAMPGCAMAGGHPPAGLSRASLSGRGRCGRLHMHRQPPSGTRQQRRSGQERDSGPSLCPDAPPPLAKPCQTLQDTRTVNSLALALHPPRGGCSGPWLYQGNTGHRVHLSVLGSGWHKQGSVAASSWQTCSREDGCPVHYAAGWADTCEVEQIQPRGAGTLLSPPVAEAVG